MLEELIGMNDNKPMGDRVYIYDSLMPSKVDMSVQKQVCNVQCNIRLEIVLVQYMYYFQGFQCRHYS